MKDSIILYLSQYQAIRSLNNEQLGRLYRAIFEKQLGNEIILEDDIKIAFAFINNQLVLDKEKYEKRCRANKINGLKGGRPKKEDTTKNPIKPNGFFQNPNDNDNDNDNDNENENENDNDVLL